MKTVFEDVPPFSLIEVDWRFRGAYWLRHQDDKSAVAEIHFDEIDLHLNFQSVS
jgi:hypothetical protein